MALTGNHATGDANHTTDHNLIDSAIASLQASLANANSPSGQAPPAAADLPPHWTFSSLITFPVDLPIGSFLLNTNGSISTSAPAYPAYGNTLNFYHDGNLDTSHNAQYYPSKTVSVENGVLKFYQHSESIGGFSTPLGAAFHPIVPGQSPSGNWLTGPYGRYAFRMRTHATPAGADLNNLLSKYGAVALLINTAIGTSAGEIDWPEGDNGGTAVAGFFHPIFTPPGETSFPQASFTATGFLRQEWHTYVYEWLPNSLQLFIDGILIYSTTTRVPNTGMAFVIQAGSTGAAPDPATTGLVEIDWYAQWNYSGV